MTGNRPIKKFRSGNVEVALWENTKQFNSGEVTFKTFSLNRSYKKKDENIWRNETINNFRRQDIPKLITVLTKMQEELYLNAEHDEKEEGEEE